MRARALVLTVAVVFAVAGAPWLSIPDVAAKRDRLRPTPCTVEPRALTADSGQPAATPLPPETAGFVADAFVDSPEDLPQGEPAQEETVSEVTATLQEYAGCVNSGRSLQVAAQMTDNALAYLGGVDAAVAALDSQRAGDSANRTYIKWLTVSDVRVLQNDRVGAVVDQRIVAGEGGGAYTTPVFFIFEHVDGRWLIDGQITIESDAYNTISLDAEATPAVLAEDALRERAPNGFVEVDNAWCELDRQVPRR